MAVAYRAVGALKTQLMGSGRAVADVAVPAGTASGDILFVHAVAQSTAPDETSVTSSGWTRLYYDTTSNNVKGWLFWRVAGGSEPSTYPFDYQLDDATFKFRMVAVSGADTTTPILASSKRVNNTASTTVTGDTITPSVASCLIMFFVSIFDNASSMSGYTLATSPPTFTEHYDDGTNNSHMALATGSRPETTATGSATATSASSNRSIVFLLAIQPAPTSTFVPRVTIS